MTRTRFPPDEWRKVLVTRRSLPTEVARVTPDDFLHDLYRGLPRVVPRSAPATREANWADLLDWLSARTNRSVAALRATHPAELKRLSLEIVSSVVSRYREEQAQRVAREGRRGRRVGSDGRSYSRRDEADLGLSEDSGFSRPSSMRSGGSRFAPGPTRRVRPGEIPGYGPRVRSRGSAAASSAYGEDSGYMGSDTVLESILGVEQTAPLPLDKAAVERLLTLYRNDPKEEFTEGELASMKAYAREKKRMENAVNERLDALARNRRASSRRRPGSSMELPSVLGVSAQPRRRSSRNNMPHLQGRSGAGRSMDGLLMERPPPLPPAGAQPAIMRTRSGRAVRGVPRFDFS